MYPSFTFVAANPFVIVFIFAIYRVNLLAELAVKVIVVVFVAVFAEKSVFVVLDSRPDLFVYFFGRTLFIEAFSTSRQVLFAFVIALIVGFWAIFSIALRGLIVRLLRLGDVRLLTRLRLMAFLSLDLVHHLMDMLPNLLFVLFVSQFGM